MKFGPVPIHEASGTIAAHSVRLVPAMPGQISVEPGLIRKGATITAEDIARLAAAGIAKIVVAQLEEGDLDENSAAACLADALAGEFLRADPAFTGRVNLFAKTAGVLLVDVLGATKLNSIDEAITIATLSAYRAVVAGEMVATVKIIPYGVAKQAVADAISSLHGVSPLQFAPYCRTRIGVISTLVPGLKPAVVDKTLAVMAKRLEPAAAGISADLRVTHEIGTISDAMIERAASSDEIIIIFGASAITDRRDVIPAALMAAGGKVTHLGMPVDPGNLIMLGEINGKPVIGAPGCARSPKENGFDWVLQRLLAHVPVTKADIQAMGVGGLLMEIISRPQPRAAGKERSPATANTVEAPVAAIVLAAGRSIRMGQANKLTQLLKGKALICHSVEAALGSSARPVIVVTGHEAAMVEAVLTGLDVQFVHNPDFASGMASSLKAGIAALPAYASAALVMLGDMPTVTADVADRLIALFGENNEATAIVPTLLGQRGNPVLLARNSFDAVAQLTSDEGAKRLLLAAGESVIEAPFDDPAIALDIDTAEALTALIAQH